MLEKTKNIMSTYVYENYYTYKTCVCKYSNYFIDGAKCEVITCTVNSSYAVTDRGKVCKRIYIVNLSDLCLLAVTIIMKAVDIYACVYVHMYVATID